MVFRTLLYCSLCQGGLPALLPIHQFELMRLEEVFLDSIQTAPPRSGPFGNVGTDSVPIYMGSTRPYMSCCVTQNCASSEHSVFC